MSDRMQKVQSSPNLVELKNINKIFNRGSINEVVLFTDFNLSVREGEFVSIVGSNGSGKTTLLNIICGNIEIEGGSILLKGREIGDKKEFIRARHIGRVFQDPAKGTCPELTILENMSLADNKGRAFGLSPGVNKKKTDYYRDQLSLLKLGLENKTDLEVKNLSGGQRQALALLISTLTPIDLLILDEHTAALDPRSSENVMELTELIVREKKITTLMVTHNLKYAVGYGNRMMMMHKGGVVLDVAGAEKSAFSIADLLKIFNEISIECGN